MNGFLGMSVRVLFRAHNVMIICLGCLGSLAVAYDLYYDCIIFKSYELPLVVRWLLYKLN